MHPRSFRGRAAVALVAALLSSSAPVATAQQSASGEARPRVTAARATTPPRIDGRIDEEAWSRAEVARDFTQTVPTTGAPASQRTEARILLDDDAVYVAMRMFDSAPDSIARQLARRDADDIYSDWAHVSIDSYQDRRTAFRFSINPAGVQKDVFHFNDIGQDVLWDAVWESATTVDSAGWSAEMRIPLSQLRYGRCAAVPGDEARCLWGVNFTREIARRGEVAHWAPRPPEAQAVVSRFGDLAGVGLVGRPKRLELVPYVSAQATRAPARAGDPFFEENDVTGSIGADLRYRLPGPFTLTATFNPDFGQVEADPAVVNLSAFETFFDERRPFFLEGSDIFRFGGPITLNDNANTLFFYTRRIGREPQVRLDGDAIRFADAPQQSTILGAAKLSGKTRNGWSVGVLGAATAEEEARFVDVSGAEGRATVEPLTGFFVGRARKDLRRGATVLGGLLSATRRDVDDDPLLVALLGRESVVGGVDFEHTWRAREWALSGYLAASRVAGDARVMTALQRSSTRYYQRPDAGHLGVDPSRSSLDGHIGVLSIARTGGRHWLGSATYEETSPGFETNDIGFETRADIRSLSTALQYRESRAGRLFREYTAGVYSTHSLNFDGDRIEERYAYSAEARLANFWDVEVEGNYSPEALSDRLTRGGPLGISPSQWNLSVEVESDDRRAIVAEANVSMLGSRDGPRRRAVQLSVEMRPSTSLRIRLEPELSRENRRDQFVTSASDPLATATFGRRYVFGEIEQREISLDTRVEWTLSPTLSFQLFAQPFVSEGRYTAFAELRAARTYAFDVYGRDRGTVTRERAQSLVQVDPDGAGASPSFAFEEPDFTVRSLRGNAVVRWEYRPGSALFVVWQQRRNAELGTSDLALGGDARRIFGDPVENVLLVKATYWLTR